MPARLAAAGAEMWGPGCRPSSRNPQGIEWLESGQLVATEHGTNSHDELNLVVQGGNYGWPVIDGAVEERPGMRPPLVEWVESIAPSGITRLRTPGTAWMGNLLVASLKGEQLRRVVVSDSGVVRADEPTLVGRFGRIRVAVEAPDGEIYLLTSNRNLGSPREGDDRLLRLPPPPATSDLGGGKAR